MMLRLLKKNKKVKIILSSMDMDFGLDFYINIQKIYLKDWNIHYILFLD